MQEKVAVLGAGTMGRGIAQVAAQAGFEVWLRDVREELVQKAVQGVKATLDKGVQLGKVRADEAAATLARIRTTTELAQAAKDAAWIIEAVPEDLELKRRVFREAEPLSTPRTLLATNTSGLSVSRIAEGLARPGQVVGLHFFNPPHLLRLLEVVRGSMTSQPTVDRSLAFARALGKEPILVRDSPGFASSRLGVVLGLEAIRMLEQGVASAEDIDRAMELGYNHPMGPLRLTDLVGLDVRLAIADHLHRELKQDQYRAPELLRRLVSEGKLGKKTGEGFYKY